MKILRQEKISKKSKKCLTTMQKISIIISSKDKRSLSSAGRASALQAGGHRFEPYSDHHLFWPGSSVG